MAASLAISMTMTFIIISSLMIHLTESNPRIDIVGRQCNKSQVKDSSNYVSEFENVKKSMREEMHRNKFTFHKHRFGWDHGQKMYVFSQCMDDLSGRDCMLCFNQISALLAGCFPSTGGRVYLDGCFMRLENYNFFHETDFSLDDTKRCGTSTDSRVEHNETVQQVIAKLKTIASRKEGFAQYKKTRHIGKIMSNGFADPGIVTYGMAMCWKTLDTGSCSSCLSKAVDSVKSCLPATEGRFLNCGCYLRFSDYQFATKNPHQTRDDGFVYLTYVIAAVGICIVAIVIGFFLGKVTFRRHENRLHKEIGKQMGASIHNSVSLQFIQFKHSTLQKATQYFSASHKIGEGGFGEVYKGTLADGREIAIKRLFISGKTRAEEVYNEMDVIGRAQHKNLVQFLGCCFTDVDSFLVYEYLPQRSLNHILFDSEKKEVLDWKKRLGIIMGTAHGLKYLHQDCQVRIIHRDIKASNILLDLRFKPKIADFGLARFYSCDKSLISTAIAGTLGYMAPEYLAQGRLTEKVDVYSYGVLLLEIVSGLQTNKYQSDHSLDTLVTTVWKHYQSKTVTKIMDKTLVVENNDDDDVELIEEIIRVVQVGLLCTQEAPNLRPNMKMVIEMLETKDHELPQPTKPPFIVDDDEEENVDDDDDDDEEEKEESMEETNLESLSSTRRRTSSSSSDICGSHPHLNDNNNKSTR